LVHLRIQVPFIGRGRNMNTCAQQYKNRILAALPKTELSRLARYLTPVTLKLHQTLSDGKSAHGYFMEQGIASVVITLEDGRTVEVGVIGCDGFVGMPILLGTESAPGRTFMQIAGSAFRIERNIAKEEFERTGELRRRLHVYMQAFYVQSAQTAACNRLHNIEERLARWLLTCRDRVQSDWLPLTHEILAQMLGAPRTTVTLAAGLLQQAGLIEYSRGVVTIQNRVGLERAACECYRTVRDEFRRLDLL
jgi:CRP-like cAMP-binding protein